MDRLKRNCNLLILIILASSTGYESCLEEERVGLLDIKAYLKQNNVKKDDPLLPTWISDPEADCCSWERVKCNRTTARVVELSLRKALTDLMSRQVWLLNASLFLSFEELRNLDLSENWFYGCQKDHGLEKLSILKKLQVLNLGINHFNNSVLSSLGLLTSLRTLNLTFNVGLGGSFPAKELASLINLETLDLFSNFYQGSLQLQELADLKNLKVLNVSYNSFNGSIGSEGLSRFKKLETLELAFNRFDNSVLQSSLAVTSLRSLNVSHNVMEGPLPSYIAKTKVLEKLDLSNNLLNGSLPVQALANMSNLRILNFGSNWLTGPLQIEELASLKNLEILDLSNNKLFGYISPSIGKFASLEVFSLANNRLNGSLSVQGLCELKNLQELDLSENNLTGVILPCFSSLTSLRFLDLSFNRLEGKISSFSISSLVSLEVFDIGHNLFEDLFSFSSIANHTNLKVLMIGHNSNKLQVESEYSSWLPKFQLTILLIPNCNLNKLPQFLIHQSGLRVVDLSTNNLTGTFPNWLLENNTDLDFLSIRNNSFFGQFHLLLNSSSKISQMDISDNHFYGRLQEHIGEMIPQASYLNVSENAFQGNIPSSVCNTPNLEFLDLSSNNFSGKVPDKFAENCSNLYFLNLSKNRLHGQMPNLNTSMLEFLHLSENQFSGALPNGIAQISNLRTIDISSNYISGEIPGDLGNKSSLLYATIMRNNALEGKISCDLIGSSLFYLDLSYNFLSGPVPSCEFSYLTHLNLEGNKITGSVPSTLFNLSYLQTLNLKSNNLSGEILIPVVAYSDLRVLLLGGNFLSGSIPEQLCQFNKLGILDLSQNLFSGSIAHCFGNTTFGNIESNETKLGVSPNIGLDRLTNYSYEGYLQREIRHDEDMEFIEQVGIEFITKTRINTYIGSILELMSGLDLSCNRLTGEIPPELGNLSWTRALNLSHNQLTGSIPSTFSNLRHVESLDLSYNNLSGEIPSALISLNFLQVFSVAHNNLSGRLPEPKAQFGTFENSSYEGNPFLCGPPLVKSCSVIVETPAVVPNEGQWYAIDRVIFTASFASAYFIFFLGVVAVLYINPHWQRRCCYLVSDIFRKLSAKLYT